MTMKRLADTTRLAAICAAVLFAAIPVAAATLTIVNVDGPGEGFNDTTPAAPVGGNTGTTIGEQRLIAFQHAADIWGSLLDSDVEILVQAAFNPLTCTASSAVLGSAGTTQVWRDFAGADHAATWYHVALANKLTGSDLGGGSAQIAAQFNSNLGQVGCLDGVFFYYGLDNNHGSNIDLVTVLAHEFGHGLGFANFINEGTGANLSSFTDIYATFTLDNTLGQTWAEINPTTGGEAAVAASALRCGRIAWNGSHVTAAVPGTLGTGMPLVTVTAPVALAGTYQAGAASFGAALASPGVTADVELVNDGVAAASVTDACEPLVGFTAGRIALVDRGTCAFTVKALNAQNAGAVGMIVADNVAGCPPPALGGTDATITIPAVRISQSDGTAFKAQLAIPATVTATLGIDNSVQTGADASGHALLYATNPVQSGSSISHFDAAAFPNLLMEPAINGDLNVPVNDVDMTFEQMQDIGWFKADLSIAQTDSADPVYAGSTFSYVLTVNNAGSGTDHVATVTDALPAGTTFVSATGTGWTCNHAAGVVTCTRDAVAGADLTNGAAPAITVTVQAPLTAGPITNNASIVTPDPLIDPQLANNDSAETTQVILAPVVIGGASKAVAGSFMPGGTVTYTVVISNAGPGVQGDNPGDEFVDVLPAGVTLVSASASIGTALATVATNTVSWNGSLAVGESVTITITATVTGALGTLVSNQGTVYFDADGDGSNESGMVTDNPALPGAFDPTAFVISAQGVAIPTVSQLGLAAMALLLLGAGLILMRRFA